MHPWKGPFLTWHPRRVCRGAFASTLCFLGVCGGSATLGAFLLLLRSGFASEVFLSGAQLQVGHIQSTLSLNVDHLPISVSAGLLLV
jgi:hypothetical protein